MKQEVLCRAEDIGEGDAKAVGPFEGTRRRVFVVRRGGQLYAYWGICPHQALPMAWRTNAYLNGARDRIVCAAHGAEFEIKTGFCLIGAALGLSLRPAPIEANSNGFLVFRRP
jgi:nitrite reductase/ring-hydroxylating ferredoxin subunit